VRRVVVLVGLLSIASCADPDLGPPLGSFEVTDLRQVGLVQRDDPGIDLDGDGWVNNKLGGAIDEYANAISVDLDAQAQDAVSMRRIVVLASGVPCDGASCLEVFAGVDRDDGTLAVDRSIPTGERTYGRHDDIRYVADRGTLRVPLFFPDADPLWVNLCDAHAELLTEPDRIGGWLSGAVPETVVQAEVVPLLQRSVASLILRTCTGADDPCGCPAGSAVAFLLNFDDTDGDCELSLDELGNPHGLFLPSSPPDVDCDGDGAADAMSLELSLGADAAQFALP
jgi:hypothetical protein